MLDAGSYDRHGNSYSADLIGSEISSDDIPFTIKGWKQNNIIKCKKHKIPLPASKGKKKLYILAASSDGDWQATLLRIGTTGRRA